MSYLTADDLPAAIASPLEKVRNVPEELKKYVLTLLRLENNIYSLNQQLSTLYYKRNEYMEHISKNSDVIAHNTAVTAYYSKVNAELTNALGYMVAFK